MGAVVAAVKLVILLISGLIITPIQLFAILFSKRMAMRVPIYYHRFLLRLINMKVTVRGDVPDNHPALYVSNHASYLDILILGATVEGFFVAKSEVASWPFFGQLAKLGRTLFIDRTRRSQSRQQVEMIAGRLNQGDSIFVFPEGTSNDGNHVQPFKPTLMSAAEIELADGRTPLVRPVSIAYTGLYGLPTGRRLREIFAWYGDMTLVPHLWQLFQIGASEAEIWFHEPVRAADFASRKELSQYCQRLIAFRMADMLSNVPLAEETQAA